MKLCWRLSLLLILASLFLYGCYSSRPVFSPEFEWKPLENPHQLLIRLTGVDVTDKRPSIALDRRIEFSGNGHSVVVFNGVEKTIDRLNLLKESIQFDSTITSDVAASLMLDDIDAELTEDESLQKFFADAKTKVWLNDRTGSPHPFYSGDVIGLNEPMGKLVIVSWDF